MLSIVVSDREEQLHLAPDETALGSLIESMQKSQAGMESPRFVKNSDIPLVTLSISATRQKGLAMSLDKLINKWKNDLLFVEKVLCFFV